MSTGWVTDSMRDAVAGVLARARDYTTREGLVDDLCVAVLAAELPPMVEQQRIDYARNTLGDNDSRPSSSRANR